MASAGRPEHGGSAGRSEHGGTGFGGAGFAGAGFGGSIGISGDAGFIGLGGSSTGGAGESGTSGVSSAGASDGPFSIRDLAGSYDIALEQAPAMLTECTPAFTESHLNLWVDVDEQGALTMLAFKDFYWDRSFAAQPTVDAPTIKLDASKSISEMLAPALTLHYDTRGLAREGSALIPFTCPHGGGFGYSVPIVVAPDTTPPKLRVDPVIWDPSQSRVIYGFTELGFTFSEPVSLPSGAFQAWFEDPSDAAAVVELFDVASQQVVPASFHWSLGGPVSQARIDDPDRVEGLRLSTRFARRVADRAGNSAVPLDQIFEVLPSAHFTDLIDFDHEPPPGARGDVTYLSMGPACEAGGCLVLEGPIRSCSDTRGPAASFALMLTKAWDQSIQMRYRLWSSLRSAPPLWFGYSSGCLGDVDVPLTALALEDGPYRYASDWSTVNVPPCGGPNNERGVLFGMGCSDLNPAPNVRLVIERFSNGP